MWPAKLVMRLHGGRQWRHCAKVAGTMRWREQRGGMGRVGRSATVAGGRRTGVNDSSVRAAGGPVPWRARACVRARSRRRGGAQTEQWCGHAGRERLGAAGRKRAGSGAQASGTGRRCARRDVAARRAGVCARAYACAWARPGAGEQGAPGRAEQGWPG